MNLQSISQRAQRRSMCIHAGIGATACPHIVNRRRGCRQRTSRGEFTCLHIVSVPGLRFFALMAFAHLELIEEQLPHGCQVVA